MNSHDQLVTTPKCIWLTGLSGAGKSTIAYAVQNKLKAQGKSAYVLDADILRKSLSSDLGFSAHERSENVRRVATVAQLMLDAGVTVLVAIISPFQEDRNKARDLFPAGHFLEVYVDAPLVVCMRRDVKGWYAKALNGEVLHMTGISSPYESPVTPDLRLQSGIDTLHNCVAQVMALLND